MEHELRVDTEVISEAEARRVFLPIIGELLAQSNEHAVQPSKDVGRVVNLSLKYRYSCHQDRGRFRLKGAVVVTRRRI